MNIYCLKCVSFVLLSKASKGRVLEGCHYLNLKLLLILLLLENYTATIKHKESFGVCVFACV